MKYSYKIAIAIFVLLIITFLLKIGFKNSVDPLWIEAEKITNTDFNTLKNSESELQKLFDSIHANSSEKAINLISKPFLPTTDWTRFKNLTTKILKEKKVIIIGNSGSGKSTLIDRVSKIITGNPNNVYKLNCIEGLEGEHKQDWIGYYIEDDFHPGKLLNVFDKCIKNPKEKYVVIIDDADKVYRTTILGEALWNELEKPKNINKIPNYKKELLIPENLYIITTAEQNSASRVPLKSSDYRRFSNGQIYNLKPSLIELKKYLIGRNNNLPPLQKKELTKKIYFFAKVNQLIEQKIGKTAAIGQWSGLNKVLKNENFSEAEHFIRTDLSKHEKVGSLTDQDFKNINYTLKKNGKLKNSNYISKLFIKFINLGLFSEFSVAILFALVSFLEFKRISFKQKRNLNQIQTEIKTTEKKYLTNQVNYNDAYGNLLSIKDNIHEMAKKNKLSFPQVNYLMADIQETTETIDFIFNLGKENTKLRHFMKIVFADDDITKEEYTKHLQFLKEHKKELNTETYNAVKQQLKKLHHKSSLKFGRTEI